MANCPNCGSEHIQLKQDTNVNWEGAVVGWVLFGAVGSAVGAVTGEDRYANVCLDCGISWKATNLYKTCQIIENLTGVMLDLAYEKDRYFLHEFISKINPYINAVAVVKKEAEELVKKRLEELENAHNGVFGCGCLLFFFSLPIILIMGITGLFLIFIIFVGMIAIYLELNQGQKETFKQEEKKVRRKAEEMIIEAEENLKYQIVDFMDRHTT